MTAIKKIKMKPEECIQKIIHICRNLGVDYKVSEKEKSITIELQKENQRGMLRIFISKKGLTLDGSAGRDKDLNILIMQDFQAQGIEKVENKKARYAITRSLERQKVKERLIQAFPDEGFIVEEASKQYEDYRLRITDRRTKETVHIIQYNTGTLHVTGLSWMLWDDVCREIESEIRPSISQIMSRLTGKDDCASDLQHIADSKAQVERILGKETTQYLYEHDLDYIISAQCILNSQMVLPEYSPVLCPVAKSLEGFLKKVLVDLKMVTIKQLTRAWDFGSIFDKDLGYELYPCFVNMLNREPQKRAKQKSALELLYKSIRVFRHPISHSSPRPQLIVDDLSDCRQRFNNILNLIKESYIDIFGT